MPREKTKPNPLGFDKAFGLADAAPPRGWIRAVRKTVGLTCAELGRRDGISAPGVVALERSEERGTIQLNTLRRVAAAMDCVLVYAIVPRSNWGVNE